MNDTDDVIDAAGFTIQFVHPPIARVDLVIEPGNAVAALATIVRGYKQVYSHVWPTGEEREGLLADINRTKLHTPLEMLSFTWLVRDVSRAFTHQMVRTRAGAAYVQESMRFSDKRAARVLVPPAISSDASRLGAYRETVADAFQNYARMVADGVPIQDARGVLPHNVLTHLFVSYTLSTLAKTASLRYCCQAQAMTGDGEGEWKTVLEQMKASLPGPLQRFVGAPWEAGEVSCGFEASFDRECRFKERFRPNYEALKAKMDPPEEVPAGQEALPGTAGHPVPPREPTPVHLYTKGAFQSWTLGNVLRIHLREEHYTRINGKTGINLYERLLRDARSRGAEVIEVLVTDTGDRLAIGLAQLQTLGTKVVSEWGPSIHLPLDEGWRAVEGVDI